MEVRVGVPQEASESDSEEEKEPKYEDAKKAKYIKKSTLTFERRHPAEKSFESKTLFMDVVGQFVWMIIYGPYEGNMIHLKELSIYGYTNIHPSPEEVAERKKVEKEIEKEKEQIEEERKSTASSNRPSSIQSLRSNEDYKSQSMPYSR